MADRIQIRRDTQANWLSVDPILAQGEFAVETDTNQFKIGDGVNVYSLLPYVTQGPDGPQGPQGPVGPPQGADGQDGADGADGAQGPTGPQGPARVLKDGAQGIQADPNDFEPDWADRRRRLFVQTLLDSRDQQDRYTASRGTSRTSRER